VARVSKLLTAIAVLQLHDQGHVSSLYDPINAYIPDLEPSSVQWDRVTIWDLLNNVAGILDMCSYTLFDKRLNTNSDFTIDGYADIYTDFSARQRADLNLPPVSDAILEVMPACQVDKSIPCDSAGASSLFLYVDCIMDDGIDVTFPRTLVVAEIFESRFQPAPDQFEQQCGL